MPTARPIWFCTILLGCTSSAPTTTPTAVECASPTEPNTRRLVDTARNRAVWTELEISIQVRDPGFDFTRMQNADGAKTAQLIEERKAQLEPLYAPLRKRLAAIGARNMSELWLAPSIHATVRAADVAAIPCWPSVENVTGNGVVCFDDCIDRCATQPVASCTCTRVLGRRLDVARACKTLEQPFACGAGTTSPVLSCYVNGAGAVFVSLDPWLVARGAKEVRHCTAQEGGPVDPTSLALCTE